MSHLMTALAMQQKGLKPAAKIVLYWLADHHNGETGACFPSLNTLANECEMQRSTVVRHLDALEEMGLIERIERTRPNGSRTSTAYKLSIKQPVAKSNSPCCKNDQPPVAKSDPHNLGNITTEVEPVGAQMDLLPKPKPRRAQQMPEGWVPNDTNIQDAIDRNFSQQEISHEADKFRNYCHANGKAYKNFDAAWRNWLGNARDYKNRRMAGGSFNGGSGQAGGLAGAYARRHLGG